MADEQQGIVDEDRKRFLEGLKDCKIVETEKKCNCVFCSGKIKMAMVNTDEDPEVSVEKIVKMLRKMKLDSYTPGLNVAMKELLGQIATLEIRLYTAWAAINIAEEHDGIDMCDHAARDFCRNTLMGLQTMKKTVLEYEEKGVKKAKKKGTTKPGNKKNEPA